MYWELYKPELSISLFTNKKGQFLTNGGIVEVSLYIPSDPNVTDDPIYIGIKENPDDEDFKAVTYTLDIKEHVVTDSAYGYLLFNSQDMSNSDLLISEYDTNDELRLWRQMSQY